MSKRKTNSHTTASAVAYGAAPRVYQFSAAFKGLLVIGALALIVLGILGTADAYLYGGSLAAQFGGCLLALIPFSIALFVVPALWQCKLCLYEDHLEYNGLLVQRTIRKADIQRALRPTPRYGMFSVILTLYGQPFKRMRIAILGRADEALNRWMNGLPSQS
ncbi:hypothetical protein [Asticcacaulis sp. EMRT-3]|uniref:hypothetical protein n=1 Tax=Asticcacaulis sp. EMRT-3 TaxID=3040349 RepID=UPI0024AF550C|nr:hypothetical protein [Asticcacaulis sp. EMRT-3]MDI7773911.1 hypothetical protein [Asticcacaulis sp. EMRT-3]